MTRHYFGSVNSANVHHSSIYLIDIFEITPQERNAGILGRYAVDLRERYGYTDIYQWEYPDDIKRITSEEPWHL